MGQRRQLLFGMYMDALDMNEVIERCHTALITRTRLLLGVLNAAKIVSLHKDRQLRNSLMECDLLLADGQSVVWASKLLGRPLPERVAGIDIFERLLAIAHQEKRSIALLGAKPEVLRKLQLVIGARFPGLRIACSEHGYYKPEEAAHVAARIREAGVDMLFIGMTSPKKEVFLGTYGAGLDVPIQHGVGGSFDIMAGLTKRAPKIWQKTGMEWAYRVLQEPGRLWWRYFSTNITFIQMTAMEFIHPARAFQRDCIREPAKIEPRNENKRLGERS